MFSVYAAALLATIRTAIKNPKKREGIRKTCLEIRNAINAAFAEDAEFRETDIFAE